MTYTATPPPELMSPMAQTPVFGDIDAVGKYLIAEGSRLCAATFGNKARAIVLTGSMSRGEGTLKRDGAGWRVLGDATFLVVFDGSARLFTSHVEKEIENFLLARSIRCKVAVVQCTASALRKMKPHIYAYELRERGVVLWGDQSVLRLLPQFTEADIPREDGWWLLCNRMIEQLEAAAHADCDDERSAAVRYRVAKLYLAMAACYLLSVGNYQPSYRERAERLQQIAKNKEPLPSPLPLQRFARFVSECTYLKLHGAQSGNGSEFPNWSDAVSDAEAMWRWILGLLSDANPELDRAALLAAMATRQRMIARAKGWLRASCVQRETFRQSWRRWLQLAQYGSPRYLVYGAASELFFASSSRNSITQQNLEQITARLPLRSSGDVPSLTWNEAAKMVVHNFHCLVESTRS